MLEAFNPEVHSQLNRLACCADRVKETVCWAYGARNLSYCQYEDLLSNVKQMKTALLILESLEKRFHDVR